MIEIDYEEFYHGWPNAKPIEVEKYVIEKGNFFTTRQMTYCYCRIGNKVGMEPTFEINDIIICENTEQNYVILQTDRSYREVYACLLDENFKKTDIEIWLEDNEIYHKLKDVKIINK